MPVGAGAVVVGGPGLSTGSLEFRLRFPPPTPVQQVPALLSVCQ